jgi:hypothetical protein
MQAVTSHGKLPALSQTNSFAYPQKPQGLSLLDQVSDRVISPTLPFIQSRFPRTNNRRDRERCGWNSNLTKPTECNFFPAIAVTVDSRIRFTN